MKGTIQFDISSDANLSEFCKWLTEHQGTAAFILSFDGRYITVNFEPKNDKQ